MPVKNMHRQRKLLLIAAAIGFISVFLPWVRMDVGGFLQGMGVDTSVNGFRSVGILVFLCFLVTGVLSITGNQQARLEKTPWMIALGAGVVALLGAIGFLVGAKNNMKMGMGLVDTIPGIGIWLAMLSSIFIVAVAWLLKATGQTLADGLTSVKKNISSYLESLNGKETKMDMIEDLEKLIDMKNSGKITDEEFQRLKSNLL